MPSTDRGRGVLNQRQREYLLGESDIETKSPAERAIRQDIRENLRNAILDFPILLEHLEDRDLKQVLQANTLLNGADIVYNDVSKAVPSGVGLLYLDDEEVFETRVQSGIKRAEIRKGWDADVTVSIDVERNVDVDDLADAVADEGVDTDVTVRELNVLLTAGEIEPELYGRIVERRLREGTLSEGTALENPEIIHPDE